MKVESNYYLELAHEFVENTGRNIFLTGRAGTGKTTFLHKIRQESLKRSIVVAPTGVAAINAGGVTIHSFFQLPFGPILPSEAQQGFDASNRMQHRFSKIKINIIKSLDLLIIDEISMVRADLLDGIDQVLRRYRDRNRPFGGVQLLMIGDLQQLAPVVKDNEWQILRPWYSSFFFFGSRALQQTDYVSIELQKVYRQSDQVFIGLLNKVRDNQMDQACLHALNKQFRPDFVPDEGFITLTTHNYQADQINQSRLSLIKKNPYRFEAKVKGDFQESNYPTEFNLSLKVGAQVMFVKNDPSQDKLFYNGKIGKLVGVDDDVLYVKCENEEDSIAVTPLVWESTKYTLNQETKEIEEDVVGSFTQYPLKLAWAITIHKSQGLTFERAVIDAQAAFAHGQVYVALSRCKSLEGLVLSSQIASSSVKLDTGIHSFTQKVSENPPDNQSLMQAKLQFQQELLEELFNFSLLPYRLNYLMKHIREHSSSLDSGLASKVQSVLEICKKQIVDVGYKFHKEVQRLVFQTENVKDNALLQQRVQKACTYFLPLLENEVRDVLEALPFDSDNKQVQKAIDDVLEKLFPELERMIACLKVSQNGFVAQRYLETRAKSSIEESKKKAKTKKTVSVSTEESAHPKLYESLKAYRDRVAKELDGPVYMVLPRAAMVAISNVLPANVKVLKGVHGIGKKKLEQFGEDIVGIVMEYCTENDIQPSWTTGEVKDSGKPKTKIQEKSSKEISIDLFMAGKSIEEITKERGLAVSTIEGHLTDGVKSGQIHIDQLLSPEDSQLVLEYFEKAKDKSLTIARTALNEQYSYPALRWVLAFHEKSRESA